MVEWLLERITKKKVSKENGERCRERERETEGILQKAKFFLFCVHLVAIGDINDGPVSVDQSR
jgi:hypothetical protein